MRLASFIQSDMDRILARWEAFAATRLPAAGYMHPLELRDHAEGILRAIVLDLESPQTREEQAAKSMGLAPAPFEAGETAAQTHAVLRAQSGFNINQLASEYRALRASVIGLWMDACPPEELLLDDMVRFNEAIDQALAESVAHFSAMAERSRNLLLGMLGHDMRSPLQAIQMTAVQLASLNAGADVSKAAARLINSGAQMQALLEDLLDFNRTQLGLGINVTPVDIDLGEVIAVELELTRAAHPERRIEFEIEGDCRGCWDGLRLRQVLDNLLANAIAYGAKDKAINVKVMGGESDVQVEVWNQGPAIAPSMLAQMFNPLTRGEEASGRHARGIGLGLYIASEIAKAHGGAVEARSGAAGTVFSVRLPRRQASVASAT
jgi:signal transduction histidine kinase